MSAPLFCFASANIRTEVVPFTPEALDRLFSWQNEITERCNREGSDTLTSIASKLEIYAVRFCLLLALSDWACGDEKRAIDTDTVERSIRLTEYFRETAAKVQGIVEEESLTDTQVAVLSDLPDTFTTAEGIAFAAKNGMKERTFKKFLHDRRGILFTRDNHGSYSKI